MPRRQTIDIGGEVFAVMTPERARALEAVAANARHLLRHAQEWFSSEYLDNPATLRLPRSFARLDRPQREVQTRTNSRQTRGGERRGRR
jgi:hypothetical protein